MTLCEQVAVAFSQLDKQRAYNKANSMDRDDLYGSEQEVADGAVE